MKQRELLIWKSGRGTYKKGKYDTEYNKTYIILINQTRRKSYKRPQSIDELLFMTAKKVVLLDYLSTVHLEITKKVLSTGKFLKGSLFFSK